MLCKQTKKVLLCPCGLTELRWRGPCPTPACPTWGHQLHVATGNLQCGSCDWGTDILIYFILINFHLKSHFETYLVWILLHKDHFHLVLWLYALKIAWTVSPLQHSWCLDRIFFAMGLACPLQDYLASSLGRQRPVAMPQVWQSKRVPKHCQIIPRGRNHTQLKTTDLRV